MISTIGVIKVRNSTFKMGFHSAKFSCHFGGAIHTIELSLCDVEIVFSHILSMLLKIEESSHLTVFKRFVII